MPDYRLEQFLDIRMYKDLSFSPDGQSLAYTSDESGQFNVWRQAIQPDANGRPQPPVQLTGFTEDVARRAIWSPDGSRIITLADRQGSENYQVYSVAPDPGGETVALTEAPTARHEIGTPYGTTGEPFSPDGRYLAYSSNARDPAHFDVVVHDFQTGTVRIVFESSGRNFLMSWSPDGQQLLVLHIYHNINHELYLVDVATGAKRLLTPHEGDNRFYPGPWAPDGSGFYLMTDQGRDLAGLAFFRLADGAIDWIDTPEWEVVAAAVAPGGRYLAWLVNEDGYGRIYVRDSQTGQVRDFPNLPRGVYKSEDSLAYSLWFSPTEPLLGFHLATPRTPTNICLLNVETGAAWPLTDNRPDGIPEADMAAPELVRFPSADGRAIPAWLYRPPGLAPGERVPVVVSIHGGPEAQELPGYTWGGLYQYLVHRKIGVLATNIRGSTGYGRTYQTLIYHDWGGAELRDLECGAQYLQSLDWVDPARLGVMGGSYGGFATLSCVARLPDYWAAAVDIVGPSNLVTFARSVPASWRQRMRRWVGDPDTEEEFLVERSPITYVEQIQAALLVLQGAHDPRVVKAESDQLVARLRELGRTVEYVVFEDEGHGFTKPANSDKAMQLTAAWLERYLLREGRP